MLKSSSLLLLPALIHSAALPGVKQLPPGLANIPGINNIPGISFLSANMDLSKMGGLINAFVPARKAYKIEQIEPKTNVPGAKRMRIIYGPYRLKAANSTVKLGNGFSMDKGGTGYMNTVADDFPKDIMVLQTMSQIQNADGSRVETSQGIYDHHNVFFDFSRPLDLFGCDVGHKTTPQIPVKVFAAGATEEGFMSFYAEDGAIKSGYYLPKTRQLMNMIDVINYNNEEKEIYTSTQLEYLEGKPEGYHQASQQRVDPGICGGLSGAVIHPPKGQSKFAVKSSNIIALRNGWFVNARGHMHDGGMNIEFKVNDQVICDSKAIYGGEGHVAKTEDGKIWETIRESTYCNTTVAVKKGDKIFMQANYDVDLHPSREQGHGSGAGGMMGGGMSGMGAMRFITDGGEAAEQMALVITQFAEKD